MQTIFDKIYQSVNIIQLDIWRKFISNIDFMKSMEISVEGINLSNIDEKITGAVFKSAQKYNELCVKDRYIMCKCSTYLHPHNLSHVSGEGCDAVYRCPYQQNILYRLKQYNNLFQSVYNLPDLRFWKKTLEIDQPDFEWKELII